MDNIEILQPGLWTTVQDRGRWGMQRYGVSPGGAMDESSLLTANWLVGNSGEEAALECTLLGPRLALREDTLLAVCGADMRPRIDGEPLPMNRAVLARAGSVIALGPAAGGSRAYLAVAGGIDAPLLLGGRGAYPAAGLPGIAGRPLQAGDRLRAGAPSALAALVRARLAGAPVDGSAPLRAAGWSVGRSAAERPGVIVARVLAGREWMRLTAESRRLLLEQPFTVQSRSDRMGYRLSGPELELTGRAEMLSEPVPIGTMQLPAGGEPIVLMADRQTTGGYPRLLHIITADLSLLGQAAPGDAIRFEMVGLPEAQRIYAEQKRGLRQLERFIRMKHLEREGEMES